MEDMNILTEKMCGYKHGDVWKGFFVMSPRFNMDKLATIMNCTSKKVDL